MTRLISLLALLLAAARAFPAQAQGPPPFTPRFVLEWGGQGDAEGEFDFPIGIALNAAGEALITDFKNSRVQRFSADGRFLSAFSVAPFPGGIALDRDGNIYTAHFGIPPSRYEAPRQRDKLAVHGPTGEWLRDWGEFGEGDGQFNSPGGLAISGDGRVFVADSCNRRMQVFDTHGKFLAKWGKLGSLPGEFGAAAHPKAFFAGPIFVALDPAGNVFTTEAGTLGRVQKFSATGQSLGTWGNNEDRPGRFGGYFTGFGNQIMQGPTGICADARSRLWVNSLSGRIQQFTRDGELLRWFGEEGTNPGQFYAPHGIAIDRHDCLYVVDSFNHRVQKFDVGER